MDKYQQIAQLASAADIIYKLLPFIGEKHAETLITIADSIADLADTIEGEE